MSIGLIPILVAIFTGIYSFHLSRKIIKQPNDDSNQKKARFMRRCGYLLIGCAIYLGVFEFFWGWQ